MRFRNKRIIIFFKNYFIRYMLLPIAVLLFIALGWYIVLNQRKALIETNIAAYQQTELAIVRVAAHDVEHYLADKIEVQGHVNIAEVEEEIASKFIAPIHLLENGEAWIYAPDHIVLDFSSNFSEEYLGKSMIEIFESQESKGASHFAKIAADITEAREGVGWYIWSPEKGKEISAWTPVHINGYVWTIGLSTPLSEVLESTGTTEQIRTLNLIMAVGTALILVILLMWGVDIERRRQTEKRLSKNEARYRRLFDFAPDGVSILDEQGAILECNQTAADLYGYSHPKELFGKNMNELMSNYSSNASQKGTPILQLLTPAEGEVEIEKPDGRVVDVWRKGLPLTDAEGNYAGVLVYDRDISERLYMETEFKKLYQAVEQSANSVIITDLDGNIEYVNPKFVENSGYTIEETLRKKPNIVQSGEHKTVFYRDLWQTITSGREWHGEFCNKHKNGSLYWEQTSIAPVFDRAGRITNFIAVKEDVTQQKKIEKALQESYKNLENKVEERTAELKESEERYRSFFEQSPISLWEEDFSAVIEYMDELRDSGIGNIAVYYDEHPEEIAKCANLVQVLDVNSATLEIYAAKSKEEFLQKLDSIFVEDFLELFKKLLISFYYGNFHFVGEGVIKTLTGDKKRIHLTLSSLSEYKVLVSMIDITAQKKMEEMLRRQATTDPLTGIFNRRHFFDVARNELKRSLRYNRPLSIIIFDIDHFKKVNDTYGHGVGDEVLRQLTAECQHSLRENDVFARYGGEEFVILLPETGLEQARQMAERVRKNYAASPFNVGFADNHEETTVPLTVSFGVASLENKKLHLDELLLHADKALYEAKESGRDRVCVWKE